MLSLLNGLRKCSLLASDTLRGTSGLRTLAHPVNLLSENAFKAGRAEAVLALGTAVSFHVFNEFVSGGLRKIGLTHAETHVISGTIRSALIISKSEYWTAICLRNTTPIL
jgi:hypothetical protein